MGHTGAAPAGHTPLQIYRRLLGYTKAHWGWFALAIVGMVMYSLTDMGFAALMKPFLDESFVERNEEVGAWLSLALVGVLVLRGVGTFLAGYYMAYVGQHVTKQLRFEVFEHLLCLPASWYDRRPGGEIISKLTYNIGMVSTSASKALTVIVRDSLTVLGLLGWMFYINWLLMLIFMAVTPAIVLALRYLSRRFRKTSRRLQEAMGYLTSDVEQVVSANRAVKVLSGYDYELANFSKTNQRAFDRGMRVALAKSAGAPFVMLLIGISMAWIIYLASFQAVTSEVSVGTFISFIIAAMLLFRPMRNLVNVNAIVQQGIAAGESVFALLDTPPEKDTGARTGRRFRGDLRFVGVSHRYDGDEDDGDDDGGEALHLIDLEIAANETVALVGESGAGKSTLVSLIPRLYDCSEGRIELDGCDIRDISLAELREQIAYIGQGITLFNDTVYNNIVYGRDVTRDELLEAARRAHALEFIERLPQGFETPVGHAGARLSGGQCQRIAIARGLLKRAAVLVFDEATSALDAESERAVQAALGEIAGRQTMLIIAHRFSTIEAANRIVLMSRGRIAEQGTHEELLARRGGYYDLYRASESKRMIE
ncbi:MAG: lipid A export permease/ATP-binding protein MsbA [Gammaproteobacteria bacterium]|nr:lipid A export permease/ATP-binding protein MsbA [Gammaproteobacteria bacterium]MDD9806734.1 lipid A export permease/ATP-binding protein MsbA [Gammaproteobacteria bacterium]